jgi:hypothetical protein
MSDNNTMPLEHLTITPQLPNGTWAPYAGESIAKLDVPSERIKDEAREILSHCLSPLVTTGARTGLVIGYVQSGKTSSFMAVSAWARDNGYQLIIIVTGMSMPLFNQSADRVEKGLHGDVVDNGWAIFNSQKIDQHRGTIDALFDDWRDDDVHVDDRQTSVICVLKNVSHLNKVNKLLGQVNLKGVKALIIDDEADQASLNAGVARNVRTATYSSLLKMRSLLPHVTYLQYTATPQAPLLVRITDTLSPAFCRVLTAGDGYIGGREFFSDNSTELIKSISASDLSDADEDTPPDTLVEALRVFLLGACAHQLEPKAERVDRNRSMMIHPSHLRSAQGSYYDFVKRLIERWKDALSEKPIPGEVDALKSGFLLAYNELAKTVGKPGFGNKPLPSFDNLMSKLLFVLRRVHATEVNRSDRGDPSIRWDVQHYHILVGGNMLDRGYTVQGLTVTYMPRDGARGNIDTIQQRARWLGYKESYLGYCRVYLTEGTDTSYKNIVKHEEAMRTALRKFKGPLSEWKRLFFVAPKLRLTRQQVISMHLTPVQNKEWFLQKNPTVDDVVSENNWLVVNKFLEKLTFHTNSASPKLTVIQRHSVADVSLRYLLENLLEPYAMPSDGDGSRIFGILLTIADSLENRGEEVARVVKMSCDTNGVWTSRERYTSGLHQGANEKTDYPGDREIRMSDGVTVQIYNMKIDDTISGPVTSPALAIRLPERMRGTWIGEEE